MAQRKLYKKVEVASPPSRIVQDFTNTLRRYFPTRWVRKTGGNLDVNLYVKTGKDLRRFIIMNNRPFDGISARELTAEFWRTYKALTRQQSWFAYRGGIIG